MAEPPQTIDEFLRLLRASGLVEAERLDRFLEPWLGSAGQVPDALVAALVEGGLVTPWQIDQLRKGRHKGFILGKYKLLRLLGTGGMSSVYLAEHSTLHHKVAIKVLPVKRVDQSSYLARFEREAQASARLNHPNICRAFDLDTYGSIHFIVMEYIEGIDLYAKVKRDGPLEVRETAELIRQTALGLHYAHEEGLIHRDIKPANLILDKRGTVKVLDLGLALAHDDDRSSLTREHDEKVLGTADYLAPEQARDSHLADRRSDIYALGCTLYYLLVGKAPFASGTLAERIRAHMNQPAPNLLEKRPDVPTAIAELYFRMMEKHPEARQQTAQEVADALANWLAGGATTRGRGRYEPQRRPAPRRSADAVARRAAPLPGPRPGGDSGSRPDERDGDSGSAVRPGGRDTVQPTATVAGVDDSIAARGADGSQILLSGLSLAPPPTGGVESSGLPQIDVGSSRKGGAAPASAKAGRSGSPTSGTSSSGSKSSGSKSAPNREAGPPRPAVPWTERTVAGLPVVFWLLVLAGVLIAGVLLAKNLSSRRTPGKIPAPQALDRMFESGAIDRVMTEKATPGKATGEKGTGEKAAAEKAGADKAAPARPAAAGPGAGGSRPRPVGDKESPRSGEPPGDDRKDDGEKPGAAKNPPGKNADGKTGPEKPSGGAGGSGSTAPNSP
jgi:serine/threonine protein kinase